MMKYKLIFLLMGVIFVFTSCESDLNTTPNDDDTVTPEEFFLQEDAYKKLLAGVYGNLTLTSPTGPGNSGIGGLDAGTSQYGRALMNLQTFSTDEAIWSYENDAGIADVQRNTVSSTNVIVSGAFGRMVVSTSYANEFLRQTTEAKLNERGVSDEEKDKIRVFRAEARVLRALSYYHLLDLFGKAPFTTEESPVGVFTPEQIEGVDLFNYIEAEILAALPDLAEPMTLEYARLDKGVAWTILAKLYLNAEVYIGEQRYGDALAQCENVINAGYELTPNYIDLFRADNNTNGAEKEIIFPIPSDGNFTQNFGPTTVMTNGAVGSVEQNGANLGVQEAGWGGAIRITVAFASKFEGAEFEDDDRNTIITEGRDANITDVSNPDQGYVLEKYTDVRSDGTVDTDITFSSIDFPMFRLADVYLMYAEAHLRGGGGSLTDAVGYINEIRTRANQGDTTWNISTGDLTLPFIIDERARELYWESHRRQDLRRFNLYTSGSYVWSFKGNTVNGVAIPEYRELYPIPNQSITVNPNLTQNEGY